MIALERGMPRRDVRTLFLSDLHLGSRFCRADALLKLVQHLQPEQIYLVGDIVDGWRLTRRWRWPKAYSDLLERVLDLSRSGTRVVYLPGNHDQFLRRFLDHWNHFEVRDSVVHRCADGRRLLVIHGDQFDSSERHLPALSVIGSTLYEWVLAIDHAINQVLRLLGLRNRRISASIKATVKNRVKRASDFESRLFDATLANGCAGVVCGHIHQPCLSARGPTLYANTGDWIDNCTVLVELQTGELQLWGGSPRDWMEGNAAELARVAPRNHENAMVDLQSPELQGDASGIRERSTTTAALCEPMIAVK
jgi:UDP-2,3-diacylglucosamine pyrophosphatase LpxH